GRRPRRPAPRLARRAYTVPGAAPPSLSGPLSHVTVLELTEDRGAFCGKLLADLGARVVKVEPPGGDPTRGIGPFKDDIPHPEGSLRFASLNANKQSLTLDITCPAGRRVLLELVKAADILLEDAAPGWFDTLGLSTSVLESTNPRLIHVSITGFGLDGPYRDFLAPELVAFAMGGLLNISGDPALPPCVAPESQSYYVASIHAAFGAMAALYSRDASGRGQLVEVSAQDCLAVQEHQISRYSQDGHVVQREGSQHGGAAPGRIFPAVDGFVHTFVTSSWPAFYDMMGCPQELSDPLWSDMWFRRANVDLLNPVVAAYTSTRGKDDLADDGQARHIPVVPVNQAADLVKDHQLQELDLFGSAGHPYLGEALYLNAPYILSATPARVRSGPPVLGQDTDAVLATAGLTPSVIAGLRSQGVL
ncbi:MAG: CaiB/BaiF CoA-transferase family protein, partial [Chloroflexota bacterium]